MQQSKSDLSLSTDRRLHHRWEYLKFFEGAEAFRLSQCTVFRIPNELGHFRLGITLKAKARSHERNAVKRQIREAMRLKADDLGSFDYNVVISRVRRMNFPYPRKLRKCLDEELLGKLK